jgi:hypothetical protein
LIINEITNANDNIKNELNYFLNQLSPILAKHKDEIIRVKNPVNGRYIKRYIRRERDVFDVVMNSIKIS